MAYAIHSIDPRQLCFQSIGSRHRPGKGSLIFLFRPCPLMFSQHLTAWTVKYEIANILTFFFWTKTLKPIWMAWWSNNWLKFLKRSHGVNHQFWCNSHLSNKQGVLFFNILPSTLKIPPSLFIDFFTFVHPPPTFCILNLEINPPILVYFVLLIYQIQFKNFSAIFQTLG